MQASQVLQVSQDSQDKWGPLDLLERGVWDILANQALQVLPDPLATLKVANPVPQVAMGNQVALASLVRMANVAQLDQWVPEVHLVRMDPLDLLDFPQVENLERLASLEQGGQEVSLV